VSLLCRLAAHSPRIWFPDDIDMTAYCLRCGIELDVLTMRPLKREAS
jgi:hypothetical protein